MVTSNSDLRGILNVHGVESQANWLLVFTAAPLGSVLTVQVSLAPRVTVAHAAVEQSATRQRAARAARWMVITDNPPKLK